MSRAEILCPELKHCVPRNNSFLKNIGPSANTVAEPVNDLCQLKKKCTTCVAHPVAAEDSTELSSLHTLLFLMQVLMRTFNQWRPFCNLPCERKTGVGEIVFSNGKHFK